MAEYDLKRLNVAIQYMDRMSNGRNPATNQIVAQDSVLNNPNVIRCLGFIREILQDVAEHGGIVSPPKKERSRNQNYAEEFPYEVLASFEYKEDLQISYFLKQIMNMVETGKQVHIPAKVITDWLRSNGFLEKRMDPYLGKEVSAATAKGIDLGISSALAGTPPNEYCRTTYNRNAQEFMVRNFYRILHEAYEAARKNKEEKKAMKQSADQLTKELMTGRNPEPEGMLKGSDAGAARLIDKILEDPGATARYIREYGNKLN